MVTLLKLVVAGPVGAGKTTFIRSLSDIPVVETDEIASESIGKYRTTIGLDFGLLRLGRYEIHLFGTPGQERFDFMWDIVAEGSLGLVLLVSGAAPQSLPSAQRILEYLTSQFPIPFVVGVTHRDCERVWRPDEVAAFLKLPGNQILGLDATSREDARAALQKMLESALLGGRREAHLET